VADIGGGELRALLRAPELQPVTAPVVASVGSPKLLVQVRGVAELRALAPDLAAIDAWSRAHGVNGIYAWCLRSGDDDAGPALTAEGRNFNHLDAALEDSATGVAAGALTALLGRALRLHQGAVVGNPCLVHTQIDGPAIRVGGLVTTLS
jgi:predicted PhzF superfamily epimerase YddE/YHI9